MKFEDHWKYCQANTKVLAQDFEEMRTIYGIIEGCESYLEIGSSEGNSLYIFGHALKPNGRITYVDFGEKHTTPWREPKEKKLVEDGYTVKAVHGNSHDDSVIKEAANDGSYDVVFIDAGHDYDDAYKDAMNYGHLANKYILFHDIQLRPVRAAFEMYLYKTKKFGFEIINSLQYGYGVIKV